MRIICPNCASHYEVDADKIGATGQLVRCGQCRSMWLAKHEDAATPGSLLAIAPEQIRPLPQAGRVGPGEFEPVREPIDFMRARARLRPRIEKSGMAAEIRSTLGTLAVGVMVLGAATGVLGGRGAIVREVPALGAAYAAIGFPVAQPRLALQDVHSALVTEGDRTVLTLEGNISNLGDQPASVPNLTVVVRDSEKVPLYTWSAPAPQPKLAKGETVMFRSRLAAPPAAGQDVRVSFADASVR